MAVQLDSLALQFNTRKGCLKTENSDTTAQKVKKTVTFSVPPPKPLHPDLVKKINTAAQTRESVQDIAGFQAKKSSDVTVIDCSIL